MKYLAHRQGLSLSATGAAMLKADLAEGVAKQYECTRQTLVEEEMIRGLRAAQAKPANLDDGIIFVFQPQHVQ